MQARSPGVRAVTGVLLAAFAAVAVWNATHYPPGLGYDAVDHIAYATGLIEDGELPDEVGEYYTPPLFYALAGAATQLGDALDVGDPRRLAQLLNAVLAVGTAVLLLALAETLWPGRPVVRIGALGLFACGALVLKAAAMFHPETLDLFLSTVALLLAARMIARGSYGTGHALALGTALGLAQLVRAFSLWTVAVIGLTLVAALVVDPVRRRAVARALAIVVGAAAVVSGPWYAYQAARYTNPIFDRPQPTEPLWERRPAEFYVDPGLPELVTRPYRPEFVNRFAPTLYAESWGDYFGVFAWRAREGAPDRATHRRLVAQSVVGAMPTVLAVGGWLWLLACSLRRIRDRPELLLVSLLPAAGIAGMLYFTVSYPTPDGDVIKGTYMLTTAPAWALCFGLTLDRLWRLRRLRAPLAVALLAGAAVSLAFATFEAPFHLIP